MALSDLQVFQDYTYTTFQELLRYNFNLFNTATQGGLRLSTGQMLGDYATESIWNRISSLVRRRNAYGSGALTTQQIGQSSLVKVKVAAGINPIALDKVFFTWIQKNPEEGAAVVAKQLAQDAIADMVQTAIKCHVAALSQITTLVKDGTAGVATLAGLSASAALMGDQNGLVNCWVMHSKNVFDLYSAAMAGTSLLFTFGDVKVMQDGFGRPFMVTDSPALMYTATGQKYHILGLTADAVTVEGPNDWNENLDTRNGNENIATTYQAEWTFNMALKGFSWDTTNGGKSPTDAALVTATNWDRNAQIGDKGLGGVIYNVQ